MEFPGQAVMGTTGNNQACPDAVNNTAEVQRVTWYGMGVNVALAVVKLLCGIYGHSQALVADAVHSFSDCATDVMILIGVKFWSKPPDARHPHGHRRIETLVTILIGLSLAAVAVGLGYQALADIQTRHDQSPGVLALLAAALSIVTKEGLFRWTVRIGHRIGSPAVVANGWHHRSDALSSLPVLVAIGAAWLFPAWTFLDHIGAVVVALFILHAAWQVVSPALAEMVDAGASDRVRQRIHDLAISIAGVCEVHEIRTRFLGGGLQVDLHILVDGDLSVREGHDITARVKQLLLDEGPDVVDVLTHLEPYDDELMRE